MNGKVPSGVLGLDELLQGGFTRGRSVLVYGGPGSGKTTLCAQYLYKGVVDYREPGVFITLNEAPTEFKEDMANFGWDLAELEAQDLLVILDVKAVTVNETGYISLSQDIFRGDVIPFSHLARKITESVKRVKAKRLVLDSLTALTSQSDQPEVTTRYGIIGLFQVLNRLGCTSLMISETRFNQKTQREPESPLELFLASGVINLYTDVEMEGVRAIQVQKMRGVNHDSGIHPFKITNSGIEVDSKGKVRIIR